MAMLSSSFQTRCVRPTSAAVPRCLASCVRPCSTNCTSLAALSSAASSSSSNSFTSNRSHLSLGAHSRSRLSFSTAAAASADAAAASTSGAEDSFDSKRFAVSVASILNDTKCQDIVVLEVAPLVSWTSYMVFGSVFSKPQLLAALGKVEKMAAEQFGRQQQNTPGSSPWECLDFGDCVVHIMSVEQREFYDLESFYATAEEVELPFEQERPVEDEGAPKWTREQPAV